MYLAQRGGAGRDGRMVRAEGRFPYPEGSLSEWPRDRVGTIEVVQVGQCVEGDGHVRMLRSQSSLAHLEGPLEKWAGGRTISHVAHELAQRTQAAGNIGMGRSEDSLPDIQGSFV